MMIRQRQRERQEEQSNDGDQGRAAGGSERGDDRSTTDNHCSR